MHHAYSKHAEVTVPSLDDWEAEWRKNSQGIAKPKVVPVDFQLLRDDPVNGVISVPAAGGAAG